MPPASPDLGAAAPNTSPRALRQALGRFATGVTVVTTLARVGPVGMTANSFASLSLDPPLVLWSPARASARFQHFVAAQSYCIHVLAEDQQDLASHFARNGFDFALPNLGQGLNGTPLLPGCLARFECRRTALHEGGDHMIVVGEILRSQWQEGRPLVFYGGRYGCYRA